jgi:hypothetical protein
MKRDKMFDLIELQNFYKDENFETNATRHAWFLFCFKFLTCVNGDWLRCLNGSAAKTQTSIFWFVTASDEAFVRWVLEVKTPKLLRQKEEGWPLTSGGKKPQGQHESRKFSHRYTEIYYEVKLMRSKQNASQWNNLFWSYYRMQKPYLFAEHPVTSVDSENGSLVKLKEPEMDDLNDKQLGSIGTTSFEIKMDDDINVTFDV